MVDWLSLQSKAAPAAPNHITSQFEKAKSFIQESLKTLPSAVSDLLFTAVSDLELFAAVHLLCLLCAIMLQASRVSSTMEQRIAQLEKENSELKSSR